MPTAQTTGLSIAIGGVLVGITFLFAWITRYTGAPGWAMQWIALPVFGYLIAFGINSAAHITNCKDKQNIPLLALNTLSVLIAILVFNIITSFNFILLPIQNVLPVSLKMQYGKIIPFAFYMFWAGMFGEAYAAGFINGCV
jgi:hypothetical protein